MDPYTPKAFAIGEVLTAQDVNEYLVNQVHRTVLEGDEVFSTSFGNLSSAYAVVDASATASVVTFHAVISSHEGLTTDSSGVTLGAVSSRISPDSRASAEIRGTGGSGAARIDTNGDVIAVHMNSNMSAAQFIRLSGNYLIWHE